MKLAIRIPEHSLVALFGLSSSQSSEFTRKHFQNLETNSLESCRTKMADENVDEDSYRRAFDLLQSSIARQLSEGRLVVVDATNLNPEARRSLISLTRKCYCFPVAFVFDVPEIRQSIDILEVKRWASEHRANQTHRGQSRFSLVRLEREGFRKVHIIRSREQFEDFTIEKEILRNNRKHDVGPFDIVGDVHGCFDEALALLVALGYRTSQQEGRYTVSHPDGRKLIFVGDLVDRGPKTPEVIRLAMGVVENGAGFCVAGNHDAKLVKVLRGRDVKISHGLAASIEQLSHKSTEFRVKAAEFLDSLVSHFVFDGGNLVVAHAGLKEAMHGRESQIVTKFAMYGETNGETDSFGLPVRFNWAREYVGHAMVVYGHSPVVEPAWISNTVCIDTGCVFGGKLTALRYPERQLISIPALAKYYDPIRPLPST